MTQVTASKNSTTHVLSELTYTGYPARRIISNWGFNFNDGSEGEIRLAMRRAAQPLTIPERRNAPDPATMYIGNLINDLIGTVELVEKPRTAETL